ncbi:MAG: hypothetical protein LBB49_06915 [Gracilibacteraceae bacterium]|nr:hypothetical protein [Gracilibacteraceae bacterium]
MKNLLFAVLAAALLLSLTACSISEILSNMDDVQGKNEVQTIRSSKSNLSLDFPKNWSAKETEGATTIQMDYRSDKHMILLEELVSDFSDDVTLNDYILLTRDTISEGISDVETTEIRDVIISNNMNAKQFEMISSINEFKFKYLCTCVNANGIFYRFVFWCELSMYDDAKPTFDTILNSATF